MPLHIALYILVSKLRIFVIYRLTDDISHIQINIRNSIPNKKNGITWIRLFVLFFIYSIEMPG